jgi:hypothetical protein
MDITFTEIDNENNTNNINLVTEENKYWETNNNPVIPKKKKVTYDDILSSLNLVVHNGVLQYIDIYKEPGEMGPINPDNEGRPTKSILKNKSNNQTKVEPQLKNSYIYNKYFKDFRDTNIIEEPPVPMTREEYKRMTIQNLINRVREKKRIELIKSKKLLFTNNNNTINQNIYASQNNLNHLFRVHPSKMN